MKTLAFAMSFVPGIILLLVALAPLAYAKDVPQITCTAPTAGGQAATVKVQRTTSPAGSSSAWADLATFNVPGTATFTDAARVSGVGYQYRCLYTNPAGSTPTLASAVFTFTDVGTPGQGTVSVIIIQTPDATGALKAAPKK